MLQNNMLLSFESRDDRGLKSAFVKITVTGMAAAFKNY